MAYRIYHLKPDGRILSAENREFDGDAEAIHFGEGLLDLWPGVEIWQAARLVKSLPAPGAE